MSLRFNLHNHSLRSDGAATARDLVEAAARAGLTHVGVSDHFATTRLADDRCVRLDQIEGYVEELRALRAAYRDRLTVLAGLEITFSFVQTDFSFFSRLEPARSPLAALDFLLFECVNEADSFGLGLEELLRLRPFFPIPVGLAHNDIARNFVASFRPEVLAQALAAAQIFVELCPTRRHSRPGSGEDFVPYYRGGDEFQRRFLAAAREHGVLFSIGCDVHADLAEIGAIDDAARFLEEHGLAEQVVTRHYWSRDP